MRVSSLSYLLPVSLDEKVVLRRRVDALDLCEYLLVGLLKPFVGCVDLLANFLQDVAPVIYRIKNSEYRTNKYRTLAC